MFGIACAVSFCVGQIPEHVTKQTPSQLEIFQKWDAVAKTQSEAAEPLVLSYFDSPGFRQQLKVHAPQAISYTAAALLQVFKDEARAAELVHNFQTTPGVHSDVTIDIAQVVCSFSFCLKLSLTLCVFSNTLSSQTCGSCHS